MVWTLYIETISNEYVLLCSVLIDRSFSIHPRLRDDNIAVTTPWCRVSHAGLYKALDLYRDNPDLPVLGYDDGCKCT